LKGHSIPEKYGAYQPTAIQVPLKHFRGEKKFNLLTTELFGPFQIVVEYGDNDLSTVLDIMEGMSYHLTAAVVSNDPFFTEKVLSSTVNGTTYHGLRARTTGAPQNHWFGPCGDPRGAGIGSAEAI
jgi:1-pyrroline-5-carboxylate dehydrogenase